MPYMYVGTQMTDTGGNYNTAGTMDLYNGKYVAIREVVELPVYPAPLL